MKEIPNNCLANKHIYPSTYPHKPREYLYRLPKTMIKAHVKLQ